MAFNILGVDPPYYTRAETNALLSTKANQTPTNSAFTTIINNTTSSLSYLYNQISQVTPLINQEVQLDSSVYTNINCTNGVQFLKQNSNGSRDILGILSNMGYYVGPNMNINSLNCGTTLSVNNNNQLIINSNITGTNNIQKTLNITGNDTSSFKLIDSSNNVRSITGGTNINLNISNNTIFLNGNNTISGITNLNSTLSALQSKLNITGNDTSSFKLIDSSNNVRSITGGTNINLNVSNNTILLSGNNSISGITNLTSTLSSLQPALISDNTFGANPLLNGNTIKSISVGGSNIFMSFPNPNSIQLYTNNIQSTLTANGNDSTSYKMLDTGTNTIRSITGGTNINLNISNNTIFINGNNSISGITNLNSTLSSLQPTLNIIGNDSSSYKLIDSSNNVRSIAGGTNITMTNNSNNLVINGPSFYGNDGASGYSLIYNNVVKSLKPYGCITFSSNNNSITINGPIFNGDNTPANGINLLYQGYVRSIVASDGIILAYNPTSVVIGANFDYLYSKSDVDTIVSGLNTAIGSCYTKYQSDNKYATVTTVSNISGYTFSNEFTLTTTTSGGKTTTNVAMNFINMLVVDGLLSALAGKNDLLTIRGDDTNSGGYKLINSSIARSLKPGLNITLTQNSNDITIAGPDLSNYVTTGGLATALGTSYIPNTNDTSYVKAYYNQLSNGNNVVKIGLITFGNNSKIQSYTLQFDIEAIVNAGENCQCNTVFLNLSAPILDTYTYNVFYAAVSRVDMNSTNANIPVDFVICQESSSYQTVTYGIYADFDCDTVNYTVKAPPQAYVNLNTDLGSPYNFPTPNKTLNYNPVALKYYSISPYFAYNTNDQNLKWSLVGRVTLALGERIFLRMSGGSGYNSSNAELNIFTMVFSNANGVNYQAGSTGNFYGSCICYSHGGNTNLPNTVRIVQETASSIYAIYFYIGGYTNNIILETAGGAFTFVNTTLSAFPSGVNYIEPPIYTILNSNNYASKITNNSLSIAMVNNLQSSLDAKAPLATPAFTASITITGTGTVPLVKLAPSADGNESSIGFYRKNNQSLSSAGDGWFIGHNVSSVGSGNFGIGTSNIGACLTINNSGVASFSSIPTVPTASVLNNTTQVATTAFVNRYLPWVGGRMGQAGVLIANSAVNSQVTASVTRPSTGNYVVTFSSPHPSGTSYCAVASALNAANPAIVNWDSTSSTQVSFFVRDNTATYTNLAFNFLVF